MTQVDFYILNNASLGSLENFSCKLAEKAFKMGHSIHILTCDKDQTDRLDKLLWTFNDRSFVPHTVAGDELAANTPIHIGHNLENVSLNDVLINLQSVLPANFAQFNRIAELVSGDAQQRQSARLRYREYQQQQCTVATHEVNG